MADALRMDVHKRSKQLIDVQFDLEKWHVRTCSGIVPRCPVDSFWHKFQYEIEVDFVRLMVDQTSDLYASATYFVSVRVKVGLEVNNVWMSHLPHDLQFTIL